MSIEENKQIMRRCFEEMWNKGNESVIDEYFSPGILLDGGSPR